MFASGRCSCSRLELLHKGFKVNTTVRQCAVTKKSDLSIKIPPRIERGPTDLLKALSATVKDHENPPYKYPDDPLFYPNSNLDKRQLALAMESGRKSARYIFEHHPKLFNAKISDPLIEAFVPEPRLPSESEMTEDTLLNTIKKKKVKDAQTVYDVLQGKGIEISKDTKQLLLELVCFYNCEERPSELELEFKWFAIKKREIFKTWKDSGFAEKLFNSMEQNCPLAVSAMILGRLKYNQIEKGVELFEHALSKNLNLPVEVYNEILSKAFLINYNFNDLVQYITKISQEMESKGVQPNLNTLNAVLETLDKAKYENRIPRFALNIFYEFISLEIQPSLGTYYYLVQILLKNDNFLDKAQDLLIETLQNLMDEKLELRSLSDLEFFPGIMFLIYRKLKNPEVSNLLNDLLINDNNVEFLSKSRDESFYYKNFFLVHFQYGLIENAMKLYERYVPQRYSPETAVYEVSSRQLKEYILTAIFNEGALQFLPKMWKDLNELKLRNQFSLLEKIMEMVLLCDENQNSETLKVLSEVADFSLNLMNQDKTSYNLSRVRNLDMFMSNIFVVYVRSKEYEKAYNVFKRVTDEIDRQSLNFSALQTYLDYVLSKPDPSLALEILRYAEEINNQKAANMAARSLPHLQKISPHELKWVINLAEKVGTTKKQTEGKKPPIKN